MGPHHIHYVKKFSSPRKVFLITSDYKENETKSCTNTVPVQLLAALHWSITCSNTKYCIIAWPRSIMLSIMLLCIALTHRPSCWSAWLCGSRARWARAGTPPGQRPPVPLCPAGARPPRRCLGRSAVSALMREADLVTVKTEDSLEKITCLFCMLH